MSVNEVRILGNLGADPDLRSTKSGKPVASLSIATSEQWLDDKGEKQERTEWHRVTVFGKQAEAVARYKKKGDELYVSGSMHYREYVDKDGVRRWSAEVKADRVHFTRGGGGANGRRNDPHPADLEDDEQRGDGPPPHTDDDFEG